MDQALATPETHDHSVNTACGNVSTLDQPWIAPLGRKIFCLTGNGSHLGTVRERNILAGHPEAQPDVTAVSTSFHSSSVLVRIFHVFAPICSNLQFFAVNFALLR
jgi:hypothetical protein